MGRIRLTSEMSEEDIFAKIQSVFSTPMGGKKDFQFEILQSTGGKVKTQVCPALSSTYKWTAGSLAPRNTKTPLYILAREPLKVSVRVSHNQHQECILSESIPLTYTVPLVQGHDLYIHV